MRSLRGWATALGAAGFGAALYLTAVHYGQGEVPLACSSQGLINCDLVTSSAESMVGTIPVALLGVVWTGGFLALLWAEGVAARDRVLRAELGWAAAGLAFVFYLVYSELFLIGAICLWCTVVHVVVVLLFLITLYRAVEAPAVVPVIVEDRELPAGGDGVVADRASLTPRRG